MNALAPMPYDQDSSVNVTAMPHNLEAEQALLGALMFDNGELPYTEENKRNVWLLIDREFDLP